MTDDILLLDDGRVQLKVLDVKGTKIMTEVTVGGLLSIIKVSTNSAAGYLPMR